MDLPIRSTGLDVYINRVLITDKATAEIELACCHKTGSVLTSLSHCGKQTVGRSAHVCKTRQPSCPEQQSRQVLSLGVKGNDCFCSLQEAFQYGWCFIGSLKASFFFSLSKIFSRWKRRTEEDRAVPPEVTGAVVGVFSSSVAPGGPWG